MAASFAECAVVCLRRLCDVWPCTTTLFSLSTPYVILTVCRWKYNYQKWYYKKKGSKICSKSWTTAQHHIISPSNVTLMMTLEAPRTNFLKHQFILANKGDWFCHISVVFCAPLLCRHPCLPPLHLPPPSSVGEEYVMSCVSERHLSQPNAIKVHPHRPDDAD